MREAVSLIPPSSCPGSTWRTHFACRVETFSTPGFREKPGVGRVPTRHAKCVRHAFPSGDSCLENPAAFISRYRLCGETVRQLNRDRTGLQMNEACRKG